VLTLYRRHRAKCKYKSRRAKCFCPIWAQGVLHEETIRRSLDLTNWEAAQKKVREWEIHGRENTLTLGEAYDRFLDTYHGRARATIDKHRQMKREVLRYFGDVSLKCVSVDDLDRFQVSWKLGKQTVANKIGRLRSFFNFCVKREWIEKSPARHMEVPTIEQVERKPFEPEELEKIWEAVDQFPNWGIYGEGTRDRLRAFLLTLRWTGMRIGDCVQLEARKIVDGQITIRTTKNGKRVSIPLHPDAREALEKIKNGNRFYFWSGEGTVKSAVSAWERTMKRLYKICGFRAHCHRFRHNFASELLAKGIPISEVAAVLGNSAKMVEKVYGQWCKGRADSLNQMVKATWGF
jgi:integrase